MTTSRPSPNKYFLLIVILFPIAFFVFLELGLRAIGYGEDFPLFTREIDAPEYLATNPRIINRFLGRHYSNPYTLRSNVTYFTMDKPENSFRIFVHGGSSAAGFPYGYGTSIARMLEQRLKRTFPDKLIEIVDTSIVATNSYTMLDFVDEIIEQKPDAVLIYGGHNEYLGIMGVGSTMGFGATFASNLSRPATLLYLAVNDFRVFQLLQDILRLAQGQRKMDPSEAGASERKSLMAIVAKNQDIAYKSDLYSMGLAQFEANLSTILEKYRDAGVPVIIGTLVSNTRDQEAFVSKPSANVDIQRWRKLYHSAQSSYNASRLEEAKELLTQAIALDDGNADAHFLLGRVYESMGRYPKANDAYSRAKDRDQLRFRAPEAFNGIIIRNAEKYGAIVADVQRSFRAHSANRLVGNNLMLEHLHPNAQGYFLLADAFYDAMREEDMIGDWREAITDLEAFGEIPLMPADRLKARHIVSGLTASFPFKTPKPSPGTPHTFEERLGLNLARKHSLTWQKAMDMQLHYYREHDDSANVLRITLFRADAIPFDAAAQYQAGVELVRVGRSRQAVQYLEQAVRYAPGKQKYALALQQAKTAKP